MTAPKPPRSDAGGDVERALAEHYRTRLPTSRPLGIGAAVITVACVAAIAIAIGRGVGGESGGAATAPTGDLRAAGRNSVAIGRRGVAVAEDGAVLRWRVTDGAARVEQRAGRVFYRVDGAGPFTVALDAGELRAGIACFTDDAAAPTVTVTVHQGEVVIVTGGETRTVPAGERAAIGAPR